MGFAKDRFAKARLGKSRTTLSSAPQHGQFAKPRFGKSRFAKGLLQFAFGPPNYDIRDVDEMIQNPRFMDITIQE